MFTLVELLIVATAVGAVMWLVGVAYGVCSVGGPTPRPGHQCRRRLLVNQREDRRDDLRVGAEVNEAEAAKFAARLRERPLDVAARGLFADWLEENGAEPTRVEMHRKLMAEPADDWHYDRLGEFLRNCFFRQGVKTERLSWGKYRHSPLGCYETFDLRPGVEELPPAVDANPEMAEDGVHWTRARLDDVEMGYWWDGDGSLVFGVQGLWLYNGDCKKVYRWESLGFCPWGH
jgi:uncharacterized protein (TIGR02996 family)